MNDKIIVKIDKCYDIAHGNHYYAHIPSMAGLGETGTTDEEAFDELMKSLRVKIIYDSELIF